MPTLTAKEIRPYAEKAGFKGTDLDIAVAVALAESGGKTDIHSPPSMTRDNSYGLWQINMLGPMGPERRKRFGLTSNDQLYDPATNARVAYGIWQSQGWDKGWTTYGTEKYEKILKQVKTGHDLGAAEEGKSVVGQVSDAADKVPNAINAFGETVFKGVTNFGGIMVALALLGAGITFLIISSNSAKKALNVAANVVPGGNVVKKAVKGATK